MNWPKRSPPSCFQLHGESFIYFWEWAPLVKLHCDLFWSSINIPFLWHIRQGSHNFLQKLHSSFQSSCSIFPNYKAKCNAGPLLLKRCCFVRYIRISNVTVHTRTRQHTTQQSHLLQPHFQQEMTQQTLSTYS